MAKHQNLIFTFICLTLCSYYKVIESNVLFHFSFDFTVKDAEHDSAEVDEHFNKTIVFENNEISVIDNNTGEREEPLASVEATTTSPDNDANDLVTQQNELNEAIKAKIRKTKDAVEKLNVDLMPYVGSSNEIAMSGKLTRRYLNAVTLSYDSPDLEVLEKFVTLDNDLYSSDGSEALDAAKLISVLRLNTLLQKYDLRSLRAEVKSFILEVRNAREAWQRFIKMKLIEVAV